MKSVDASTKSIEKNVGRINKRMGTFDMRLLSLMFGGMALKRVMGSMARSLIDTFLKAEDSTSGLAKATVRLSASWEFLKFSIMDALNTEFFLGMIDNIIRVIEWFAGLGDTAKQMILGIIGGLFLLGSVMMVIGQTKLFTDAVFGGTGFLGGIIKSLGFTGILGLVLVITAVVITMTTKWDELKEVSKTWWDVIKDPLSSIKKSLDEISQLAGFIDFFDLISTTGLAAFMAFGAVLLNVAFAIDFIIIGLSNLAKGIKAVLTGDWDALIRLSGESFSEGIDWFDRWTDANSKYLTGMDKVGEMLTKPRVESPEFGGGEFGGIGITGGWGEALNKIDNALVDINANTEMIQTAATTYGSTLIEEVVPQVESFRDSLTGEGGLLEGMGLTGTEMDLLAGEKTIAHTTSTNTQITNNDNNAASWRRLLADAKAYANFQVAGIDTMDRLINEGTPSGG